MFAHAQLRVVNFVALKLNLCDDVTITLLGLNSVTRFYGLILFMIRVVPFISRANINISFIHTDVSKLIKYNYCKI